MCFKKKKGPAAPVAALAPEDPALKRQLELATADERRRRSLDKETRFEEQLGLWGGKFGRRSLLTGAKGGAGYVRSLFGLS